MLVGVNFRALAPFLLLSVLSGCNRSAAPVEARAASAEQTREFNAFREDIDRIPPPSKTRYMAVRSLSTWENPYLTIQGGMVTLHVLVADANTSSLGEGGLLRPTGARRQELNVRTEDLPAALNAVPPTAWPYGRVVAVEEAHATPAAALPQVRRNMEAAIRLLSDLGVVVYEWQEGGVALH